MERGDLTMIIFTILLIAVLVIAVAVLTPVAIVGGSLAIVFSDVIVFGLIVWLIVKVIKRLRRGL